MDKKSNRLSDNDLDNITENYIDTTYLKEAVKRMEEGRHIPPSPYYKETQEEKLESLRYKFNQWVKNAPDSVVFICKILQKVFDYAGFAYMIVGGLFAIISFFKVFKSFRIIGLGALISSDALSVIFYIVAMIIIDRIRLLLCRIIEGV